MKSNLGIILYYYQILFRKVLFLRNIPLVTLSIDYTRGEYYKLLLVTLVDF